MSGVDCKVIVIMGVTGCGKTTIGKMLSETMAWSYYDADDFHPKANVDKMARGVALNDEDRWPWLQELSDCIGKWIKQESGVVLACSALKEVYRQCLLKSRKEVSIVHLVGSKELISQRLEKRVGHYMPISLLESQFQTLEPPRDAIKADIKMPPVEIVKQIQESLHMKSQTIFKDKKIDVS